VLSAVLDTNVIVSGIISRAGAPSEVLTAWRDRRWNLVTSLGILREVERVLTLPKIARRYAITGQDATDAIRLLKARAAVVPGTFTIPRTARDPDDDHILACAIEGHADHLVTGDQDLLALERFQGIPIISPRAFATILKAPR
jgi:putative PIN family toxin of toxin-antitoxin system